MPTESRKSLTTDADLQDVLDSAGNAARTGLQQFLTPERLAAALALPLPRSREVAADFTAGTGALLRGLGARACLGVDLDAKAIGRAEDTPHPDGLSQTWATATADFTRLFGLLADTDCRFDLLALNPPFSMQWDKARFNALATSECRAVREVFGSVAQTSKSAVPQVSNLPGEADWKSADTAGWEACATGRTKPIDSTLATFLAALDRLTPAGEGYILGNESTFIKLLGAPDGSDAIHAPCRQLREHVWLWLSLPEGTFPTARLAPAVLYFAKGHSAPVNSPIFQLTVPDYGSGQPLRAEEARTRAAAIASAAAQTLSSIPQQRLTLRHGMSLHAAQSFCPGTVERWRACLAEYRTAVNGAKGTHEFNLWIEGGKIKRHLTPFQHFSGKIPKKDAEALNHLHGQSPFALVMQKATRLALLRAVRGEADGHCADCAKQNPWRVDPALAAAVDAAMKGYHAARAPLYTPNPTQSLGWLDEEDAITCTADLVPRQYISGTGSAVAQASQPAVPQTSSLPPGGLEARDTADWKSALPWHQSTTLVPARLVQRNKAGEWVGAKDASQRITYGKTREYQWKFTETFDREEQAVAWVCGGHREVKPAFVQGRTYQLTTATRVIEREHRRPNAVSGKMEDCTLHGQELVIRLLDAAGGAHEFGDFTPAEAARTSATTHPIEALTECFRIPEVEDVAKLHPEKFAEALQLIGWLDSSAGFPACRPADFQSASPGAGSGTAVFPNTAAPSALAVSRPEPVQLQDPETAALLRLIQAAMRNNVDADGRPAPIRFGSYQRQDMARGLVHGGALMGWEPGLGKTFPLLLFGILGASCGSAARRHLLVAPEGLHDQICREARDKFGLEVRRLTSQEDFAQDALLQESVCDHLAGRRSAVRGWWITSYSQLGYNGADEFLGKEDEDGNLLQSAKILRERHQWPGWNPKLHDKGIGETRSRRWNEAGHLSEVSPSPPVDGYIRCVCRPTLATLLAPVFGEDAYVGCDEAVRLKANDSYTSLGVRRLSPQFRLVLTGTPIKNHLDDIFWLLWWAAGGSPEPTARFPYAGTNADKEKFAREFMLIEQNHTREEEAARKGAARSIRKRVPILCNLHRLWKFLGPLVIRRRKDEIADIVPKRIVPITVTPGTAQQVVYQHHLVHKPQFTKDGRPMAPIAQILAQLTTLRVAALCPDSALLSIRRVDLTGVKDVLTAAAAVAQASKPAVPQTSSLRLPGGLEARDTADWKSALHERIARATSGQVRAATSKAIKVATLAARSPFAAEADTALHLLQRMIEGDAPVDIDELCKAAPSLAQQIRAAIHVEKEPPASRSWTDHNPKQAAILAKIAELLAIGERVVVMAPFQDFGRALFRRLQEAGVDAVLLDGDTSPAKRGRLAREFKRGRYAVLIGGSKSMGEGHSFECASHLIAPSIDWALDVNRQVEDRVHRLNSPRPVTIYAMVTANSIDVRLAALYREKADAAGLALDGRIRPDDTAEVNLAALLRDAVRNFDPKAPTIDERMIEQEWNESLKARLALAMRQFREFIPIVDDTAPVTKAEVKTALLMLTEPAKGEAPSVAQASQPAVPQTSSLPPGGGLKARDTADWKSALRIDLDTTPTPKPRGLLAAVPDGTLRVLLGLPLGADIAAPRAAFEAFARGRTGDWRKLWKEWSTARMPSTPVHSIHPVQDARTPIEKIRGIVL